MAKRLINKSEKLANIGEEIEKCAIKNTSCLHCLDKNGICPKYGKSLVVKPLSEESEV